MENQIDPIKRTSMKLADHAFRTHDVIVPVGVPVEALTDHQLYVHVADKLNDLDEIRITAEDYSYQAKVLVTFSDKFNVSVELLSHVVLKGGERTEEEFVREYTIKQMGPKKWCIVRVSDGSVIKEGLQNQSKAATELEQYLTALGR